MHKAFEEPIRGQIVSKLIEGSHDNTNKAELLFDEFINGGIPAIETIFSILFIIHSSEICYD